MKFSFSFYTLLLLVTHNSGFTFAASTFSFSIMVKKVLKNQWKFRILVSMFKSHGNRRASFYSDTNRILFVAT